MFARRIISALLVALIVMTLCSCSTPEANGSIASPAPDVAAAPTAEPVEESQTKPIEVDKGLLTVEITLAPGYVGENVTQADLDEQVANGDFISATLHEDGSATYVMTKSNHKAMVDGITQTIDQGMADLVGSEDYPMFTAITANDDYTEFTITTTSTELTFAESLSTLVFYVYGGMYSQFSNTPVDDIAVTFVNADTGEVIDTAHSSDMGSSSEE